MVSQTKSGSAPVSVISSAQSMDPTKRIQGVFVYEGHLILEIQCDVILVAASGDAYFAVKYNNLLAYIAEVGQDVKPAYTNNKSSNIVITRNTIRDLMVELEKYSRIAEENDMDYK